MGIYFSLISSSMPGHLYHKANFQVINDTFLNTNWNSLLSTSDSHASWSAFSSFFFRIIHQHTPTKVTKPSSLPAWLPCPLLHKKVSIIHSIAVPSFLTLLPTDNCITPLETLSSMNCVSQS